MAAFHGYQGAAQFADNTIFNFTRWSIDIARDTAESRVLSTGTETKWASTFAGYTIWSGSFEGFLDDTTLPDIDGTDANLFNTSGTATFTDGDGNTYSGTVFLDGLTFENDVNDLGKHSGTFKGSGALTIA